jgi:ketosteroid isomerase-like protein
MATGSDQLAENKRLVTEFLQALSRGDIAGVLARMHEQGNWWVSGNLPGISGYLGKEKFGELLLAVAQTYKGGSLQMTPILMTAEEDRVAVEAESYAELLDGRIYHNFYHLLFVMEGGRVKFVKEYMDTQRAHDIFVGI